MKIIEFKDKIDTFSQSILSKHKTLLSAFNITSKYSRIKFIKSNSDSQELINHSIAVVTCTGTAAMEALIKEKPVLLFGYYLYNFAPGVKTIAVNSDMENAYDFITSFSFNEKSILDYLQLLYNNSYKLIVDRAYKTEVDIDNESNNNELFKVIKEILYNEK